MAQQETFCGLCGQERAETATESRAEAVVDDGRSTTTKRPVRVIPPAAPEAVEPAAAPVRVSPTGGSLTTGRAVLVGSGLITAAIVVLVIVLLAKGGKSDGVNEDSNAYRLGYDAGYSSSIPERDTCEPNDPFLTGDRAYSPHEVRDYTAGCHAGWADGQ